MVDTCSSDSAERLAERRQLRTLWIVLAINLVMFGGEFVAAVLADSSALLADAADNLGDSVVYLISLVAIYYGSRKRVLAAFTMGVLESFFGLCILFNVAWKLVYGADPIGPAIMVVATLALIGNLAAFALLTKHRGEDLNMRAVWLCTRNDAIGNLGIILAGLLVTLTGTLWPDVVIATLVAMVFLYTAGGIALQARREMRAG